MNKLYFIYSKKQNQFFHINTTPNHLKLTYSPSERKEYPTERSAQDDLDCFGGMQKNAGFVVWCQEANEVNMENKLVPALIDNKNLMEDPFTDVIFNDFFDANDHYKGGIRHMVGFVEVRDEEQPSVTIAEANVDVMWKYGDNSVIIKVIGANTFIEDFEETRNIVYAYYKKLFKSWECEDKIGLVVKFNDGNDNGESDLIVNFYFKIK